MKKTPYGFPNVYIEYTRERHEILKNMGYEIRKCSGEYRTIAFYSNLYISLLQPEFSAFGKKGTWEEVLKLLAGQTTTDLQYEIF